MKQPAKNFLGHSYQARAVLPEAMLAAAALLNIRVIIDNRSEGPTPFMIAFVRRPIPGTSQVIAYVHCEIKFEWLPDEAAWIELFTQLWPGY